MNIDETERFTFDDFLIAPRFSTVKSREDVSIKASLGDTLMDVPLITANMDTITGSNMAIAAMNAGAYSILHRFMTVEDNLTEFNRCKENGVIPGVSLGVSDYKERAEALIDAGATLVCVDMAHAHSVVCGDIVKYLRDKYSKDIYIVAGNVATYHGATYLIGCGASAVKAGIGSGSVCTTRIKTGIGVPQLSAVADVHEAIVDLGGTAKLISDGGVKTSGDIVKAIAAGADVVMSGSLFAGCDEVPIPGAYRGLASKEAQKAYHGSMAGWRTAEGVSREVSRRGPVSLVIQDLAGGIRSGCSYTGSLNLFELKQNAVFVRVTANSVRENGAHFQDAPTKILRNTLT